MVKIPDKKLRKMQFYAQQYPNKVNFKSEMLTGAPYMPTHLYVNAYNIGI